MCSGRVQDVFPKVGRVHRTMPRQSNRTRTVHISTQWDRQWFLLGLLWRVIINSNDDTPVRKEFTVREHMWVEMGENRMPRYNFAREQTVTQGGREEEDIMIGMNRLPIHIFQ